MKPSAATLWLTLGYALFVVYGSLVPLDYQPLDPAEAWARFQHIPFLHLGLESRADWVANGVLYAPLAFGLSRVGRSWGWPVPAAVLASILLGCALAVGVEFTQLWFPNRTVSLNDIAAECIGSVVGALAAPLLSGWLDRLSLSFRGGGTRMLPHLLQAYALAYLLLSYFPYDLLLSSDEVLQKWHSANWGWWMAPIGNGRFEASLQWLVEVALAAPLGALRLVQGRAPGRTGRAVLWRAAGVGLALGLLIEVGQFFVDSGISQGASVLSRVLGVLAGAAVWPWLRRAGAGGVRALLRPWAWGMWLAYVPTLAAASGLFRHGWHGVAGARASWDGTHLLPFYYHYFTSEALALYSLCSVALMYAPVVGLGALDGWRLRSVVALTALLAVLVETAKLFVNGLHADPTNVLVAVVGNALGWALLRRAARVAPAAAVAERAEPARAPARGPQACWLVLPAALGWAAFFPAAPAGLVGLLLVVAALVARWPVLALALVPATLPVLDLAPWSGRYFLDEFDLLQAVALAVAWSRLPPAPAAPARPWWQRAAILAVALSLLLSTGRGLWPGAPLDANAFANFASPYNALRIVKGAAWAWALLRLWRRLAPAGARRAQAFNAGMLAGLAGTVATVVWERLTFASLWDFAADIRVTGPFSAMHRGGAYIECYLAVGAAFALAALLGERGWVRRGGAALLLLATGYAMMVTYSRNGYAALAVVLLACLAVALRDSWRLQAGRRFWALGGVAAALLLASAVPVLSGSYAQQRLAQSSQDFAVRRAHWADGLALRDHDALTGLVGMGLGRFPELHSQRSAEPVHAAGFELVATGEGRALRLTSGARLYVEQIVPRPEFALLKLSAEVRAAPDQPGLEFALCEKWTLTSRSCAGVTARQSTPAAAGWRHVEATLDASALLARPAPWRAPLKLSLFTPQTGVLEVARVQLRTPFGDALLVNGDFAQGLDHWFFATDVDPPWHLHSLPVALLFDQGWLGVASMLALWVVALVGGSRLLWRGQAQVPAALPALLGLATSGLLNTLIDAPRFLWLMLVLLGLALARQPASREGSADPAH